MNVIQSTHDVHGLAVDGYEIDVVVQGFPGKTVCHGGLG
jgi:hypothetical protein